jgi:hypothetical protein
MRILATICLILCLSSQAWAGNAATINSLTPSIINATPWDMVHAFGADCSDLSPADIIENWENDNFKKYYENISNRPYMGNTLCNYCEKKPSYNIICINGYQWLEHQYGMEQVMKEECDWAYEICQPSMGIGYITMCTRYDEKQPIDCRSVPVKCEEGE